MGPPGRPALENALNAAIDQMGALVVYSLAERIDPTSAAEKMVFRMLAVVNESERDLISKRTTVITAHLRRQDRFPGHVPYGYHLHPDGKTIAPDASEQRSIRRIERL